MNEIVRKLRESKAKMVFESVEEEIPEETVEDPAEEMNESYYFVEYTYDGDDLSDYQSTVIVKANSENDAIRIARSRVKDSNAGHFNIDKSRDFGQNGKFDDLNAYKKKFPHSNYPIFEEEDIPDAEDISEESDTNPLVCECGSTNIVEEDGNLICDDCGRSVKKEDVLEEDTPIDKKPAALRKALEWWSAGHYQKAVELYKKYGVTDAEFAKALVKTIRESEEGLDLDADDLDESLDMSVATPYVESDGEESLRILINGVEYRYRSNTLSVSELLKKFMGIYKHSLGSALQWLKKNSYLYFNGRTKKFVEVKSVMKESAEIETVTDNEESNLDKNIIRAVHTPVSTAKRPSLDAAIMEAVATDSVYSESALISYLKSSKEFPVYIRTTKVKGGWDDVQFAAGRAGCRVSKVNDKSLLSKFKLPGNFAEFYVFNKK